MAKYETIIKEGEEVVKFTEADILAYLDGRIDFWRIQKQEEEIEQDESSINTAIDYIDCLQSIRVSIFGKLKE